MNKVNYHIEDNFLSEQQCRDLIKDSEKNIDISDFIKIHANRKILNSGSLGFEKLTKNSSSWDKFKNKLESRDFFEFTCKKLDIDASKFKTEKYFNLINNTNRILKQKTEKKMKEFNNLSLIKVIAQRYQRDLVRYLKFTKLLNRRKAVELLYDYSISGKSYNREIHRDSDNRLVVFLIYLNELNGNEEGGNLIFYEKEQENFKEVIKIEPSVGKLVLFENNDTALHAVDPIKQKDTVRHFIYGAFTILSGENPLLNSTYKSKTDFYFYE